MRVRYMSMAEPPTPGPGTPLIELRDIRKSYNVGRPNQAEVLHGVALTLARGEFVALIGPSGSGKSTLLNVIGPDDAAPTQRRATALGFGFQFHHLLRAFTALENVTLLALMRDGRVTAAQEARPSSLQPESFQRADNHPTRRVGLKGCVRTSELLHAGVDQMAGYGGVAQAQVGLTGR
jgi:ABC-type lipoprotein export system ATPase subunit